MHRGRFSRVRAVAALARVVGLSVGVASCSALLRADADQCAATSDCTQKGFASSVCSDGMCVQSLATDAGSDGSSDPAWGCVGSISWPPQDDTRQVTTEGRMLGLFSEAPIVGSTVRACAGIDFLCTRPIATATTDARGIYSIKVPFAFRGFLEVTHAAGASVMPLLLPYTAPPVADQAVDAEPVHVPTESELQGLLQVIGRELVPEAGHVFGLTVNCQGKPTSGVVLQAAPVLAQSLAFYTDESRLPATTQTSTSSRGEGGFINLPVGPVTLRYSREAGQAVGSLTVPVRKGAITAAVLGPTPLTN